MLVRSVLVPVALVVALAGCSSSDDSSSDAAATTSVSVQSSDDACVVSVTDVPAGSVVFTVENTGKEETEFYLFAEDGKKIISEVEGIGPGISREMKVKVKAGSYITSCKPGDKGDGIRASFTVTASP